MKGSDALIRRSSPLRTPVALEYIAAASPLSAEPTGPVIRTTVMIAPLQRNIHAAHRRRAELPGALLDVLVGEK